MGNGAVIVSAENLESVAAGSPEQSIQQFISINLQVFGYVAHNRSERSDLQGTMCGNRYVVNRG
jgi:hypothetical protein